MKSLTFQRFEHQFVMSRTKWIWLTVWWAHYFVRVHVKHSSPARCVNRYHKFVYFHRTISFLTPIQNSIWFIILFIIFLEIRLFDMQMCMQLPFWIWFTIHSRICSVHRQCCCHMKVRLHMSNVSLWKSQWFHGLDYVKIRRRLLMVLKFFHNLMMKFYNWHWIQ